MAVKALVLRTAGTNCDGETMQALSEAGAKPELLHLSVLAQSPQKLFDYKMLVVPGGFSYGDDVAAGKILANEMKSKLASELRAFVEEGRLVIGVCNGFQVLVKLGILPDLDGSWEQTATLAHNDSGRFQCEWVGMKTESSKAAWLKNLPKNFELPMAHGEGKFVTLNPKILAAIEKNKQVAFRYDSVNPNGSARSIAGITNRTGNVIGLMPHPERYLNAYQHPDWGRQKALGRLPQKTPGFLFWQAAVKQAASL